VADAQTLQAIPIQQGGGGVTIGELEVRFSRTCNSYWGRTISFIVGVAETDVLQPFQEKVVGPFRGSVQETYTDMAFGSAPELAGYVHSAA